jgi:uncharacterized membrane-anchored protein
MTPFWRGILLAVVQVGMVLSLGAKLLADRARYPRVWAESVAYDPEAIIRGRYVSLRLKVKVMNAADENLPGNFGVGRAQGYMHEVRLGVEEQELVAYATADHTGLYALRSPTRNGSESPLVLQEPVEFFIPEHAEDPSRRPVGEELWVEVTVPPKGPPRPIRLGIKKAGTLTPLKID